MSFFLAIPALTAAGVARGGHQGVARSPAGVGWGPTLVALVVSFFVAYASIAWLLRYVAGHDFSIFIVYRILLGLVVIVLIVSGAVTATCADLAA